MSQEAKPAGTALAVQAPTHVATDTRTEAQREADRQLREHTVGMPYRITPKGTHVPQAVGRVIASLAVDSIGRPLDEHTAVTDLRVATKIAKEASKRGLSGPEAADMDRMEQDAAVDLLASYKGASDPRAKARAARDFLKLASLRARRTK